MTLEASHKQVTDGLKDVLLLEGQYPALSNTPA